MFVDLPLEINAEVQVIPAVLLHACSKWIWFWTHESLPSLVYVWVITRSQIWISLELLYFWKSPLHSKVCVEIVTIEFVDVLLLLILKRLVLLVLILDALWNPSIFEWLELIIWILEKVWWRLVDGWVGLHVNLYDLAIAVLGGYLLHLSILLLLRAAMLLEYRSMLLPQIRVYFENGCRRRILHPISWCICFQLLKARNKFSRLVIHWVLSCWLLAGFHCMLQIYVPRVIAFILLHLR